MNSQSYNASGEYWVYRDAEKYKKNLTDIFGLPLAFKALEGQDFRVYNTNALDFMEQEHLLQNERAFIFLDPPYLEDLRSDTKLYQVDMPDVRDHIKLLESIKNAIVVYCSTRNELINAINAKAVVIEIDGALKKDMDSELKKQLKTQKKAAPIKNLGKGVGIISAVGTAMALINPVTWIAFGGASLASVLAFTIGGTAVAGMPFECSSVKITKALMKEYRVTQEELHMQAMENMKKDGYAFRNMKDIFADFLPVEIEKNRGRTFCCWGTVCADQ